MPSPHLKCSRICSNFVARADRVPADVIPDDGSVGDRVRDARRVEVGRVRRHERVVLAVADVGDLLLVKYEQDDSASEVVGVAEVVSLCTDDEDILNVHWYGTTGHEEKLTGSYLPSWDKTSGDKKRYYAKEQKHHGDAPTLGQISIKYNLIHHGFALTRSANKIPKDAKRRACSAPNVKWQMTGHAGDCECVAPRAMEDSGAAMEDSDD